MNIQLKGITAILGIIGISATQAADFEDYARVIRATPQVEQFNQPEERCKTEYVAVERQQSRNMGGALIGGVAGALLGSQVGNGNGRIAASAAGAVTGALVGDRLENNNNYNKVIEQPIRRCHTVDHWESRVSGYAVTYEYRGHNYTTTMPYDPGERIKVQISISPKT